MNRPKLASGAAQRSRCLPTGAVGSLLLAALVGLCACGGARDESRDALRDSSRDTSRDARRGESSGPLIVFAASDLRDALTEIAAQHQRAGGDSAVLVFGSTGDLGRQIANGAPADLFFAANAVAIDGLAATGDIVDSTRRVYAIGRLALIGRCPAAKRPCATLALRDLAADSIHTVAIADPAHAPYGMAAKQALERAGLWAVVEPKLVRGANVSQAEQFVSTGNADAGLVALSLVLRTPDRAYTLVDSALHDPLRQTVAVMSASGRVAASVRFLQFLSGDSAQTIMRRFGFSAPPTLAATPIAPAAASPPRPQPE